MSAKAAAGLKCACLPAEAGWSSLNCGRHRGRGSLRSNKLLHRSGERQRGMDNRADARCGRSKSRLALVPAAPLVARPTLYRVHLGRQTLLSAEEMRIVLERFKSYG